MPSKKIHNAPRSLYRFGPFSLEVEERRLLIAGEPVPLTSKVFDLLLLLVESAGSLRTRSDLIENLWPDTIVEEHSLTSRISALRKALGDEDDPPRYIETVRGQGYRFIADVSRDQTGATASAQASGGRRRMVTAAGVAALLAVTVAAGVILWRIHGSNRPAVPDKSIAVLPFENLSPDKANGYFAEGIQDMILTKLADIRELKVISRTSADRYTSHPGDLRTIARQLGVSTVLEGSVQKDDNRVLVNVQLIDARTDQHIWAKSYTRTLSDVFNVESDVSQRVADQLKLELLPSVAKRLQTAPTRNAEAYDLLLKADHYLAKFWSTGDANAVENSIADYRKAITHDHHFALAYAQMSYALMITYYYLHHHTTERLSAARSAADKALVLAPDLAQAHSAKGYWYYWGRHDYPSALVEFKQALALKPQDAFLRLNIGSVYRRQGHWQDAVKEISAAVSLDPRNVYILRNLSLTYSALRRYKEAMVIERRALSINPDAAIDISNLAYLYDYTGRPAQALSILDTPPETIKNNPYIIYARLQSLMLDHDFSAACNTASKFHASGQFSDWFVLSQQAATLGLCGHHAEARRDTRKLIAQLRSALEKTPDDARLHAALGSAYVSAGQDQAAIREGQRAVALFPMKKDAYFAPSHIANLAQIYAQAGEPVQAVQILKELLNIPAGDEVSIPLLKLDPVWDPIRSSPEFKALLKQHFTVSLDTASDSSGKKNGR